MSSKHLMAPVLILIAMITTNCTSKKEASTAQSDNPLLQKWSGPYNGVPPFDKIKVEYFKPAMEAGMAEYRDEINRIVANTEAPSFKNTLEELERCGTTLKRVFAVYGVWKSNLGSPQLDSIQEEMEPKLTTFYDSIVQNTALFNKIEAVYNDSAKQNLNAEQKRLLERY